MITEGDSGLFSEKEDDPGFCINHRWIIEYATMPTKPTPNKSDIKHKIK
jgi:hypothetical protein